MICGTQYKFSFRSNREKINSKQFKIQNQFCFRSNREKIDPKQFTIENEKSTSLVKKAGSINGQQFIIQNCEHVNIGLFDFINTITIDDCNHCSIFIGPTSGRYSSL